jgi:glutathione peroxidase-family protein
VKFLVDHEGLPYERYNETDPVDLKNDIETLLMIKEVAAPPS